MLNTEREPDGAGAGDAGVRRAVAADIEAMASQLAKTFWDDPVASHLMRNPAPGARPACGPTSVPR